VRVDLGDDQRHVRIHAERVRLVDHGRAGLDDHRRVLFRLGGAGRAERDLDALERRGLDPLDRDRLAAEGHGLADRALRGERAQLAHRELSLLEDPERGLPRRAGGSDHRDAESGSHQY
jgi:hypothetical protein